MGRCYRCGNEYQRDFSCCHRARGGVPNDPAVVRRGSRGPDETECPDELRGLGWLDHDDGTCEPAWRAVVEGRARLSSAESAREHLEELRRIYGLIGKSVPDGPRELCELSDRGKANAIASLEWIEEHRPVQS